VSETPPTVPYTPALKGVLAAAAKEAKAFKHTYVGTEHFLLGLLQENEGVCARVFKNLKVDVEKTRQEIIRELSQSSS
jgi:ATP-dependent Clp protease ATP-binding subunit ClpC